MQTERIDLILTDILMPEADGIQVVRAVVKDHPSIALVAMSGGSSRLPGTDAVHLTHLLGAHAVLVKPFGEEELSEAVRKALEKVGAASCRIPARHQFCIPSVERATESRRSDGR